MTSTKNLSGMPSPSELHRALRFSAMLDVILCAEAWLRCYDFRPRWANGVVMGKFDNGSGDHLFALFRGNDAIIKGFGHESPVSPYARDPFGVWPGIYDGIPQTLDELLDDPSVERDVVTFCIWSTRNLWSCGSMVFPKNENDGSAFLLNSIPLNAEHYFGWARNYYEVDLDRVQVAAIWSGNPVDARFIRRINPQRDVSAALAELSELTAD